MPVSRDTRRKLLEEIANKADTQRKLTPPPKNSRTLERLGREAQEPGADPQVTADHALGLGIVEYARAHAITSSGTLDRAIAAEKALVALQAGHPPELSFETAVYLALNGYTAEAGAVYRVYREQFSTIDREIHTHVAKSNRQLQHAKAARRNTVKPKTSQLQERVIESLERRLNASGKRLSVNGYAEQICRELKEPSSRKRTIRRIVTDYLTPK